jgi:hypothetical protein
VIELTPPSLHATPHRKSRQEYAAARREKLVALLCVFEYEAHVGERLALGEEPDPLPGLGYGRCAKCRVYYSFDRLEIDHVDGCTWNKRAVNAWRRVARYYREFLSGVRMRVLCRSCNASDGSRFRRER